ncbi:hypothetical protein B0H16DRAFT_1424154 [Mycena metata]|uniref:Distal membrane-arm assembly complex protein 1-like domain-containing protein n=1 Tax=Mycena metata TaxID=1033252 RepID=A0AAD7IDE2_9AGAR|nr:hypothetical protein B0H16DRAFT_1424154 [Mycena metata]
MAETRASGTDCLACRISGTATFTGLGIYALWMSREAAPGGRGSKKLLAVFGAGTPRFPSGFLRSVLESLSISAMIVGGVVRWKQTGNDAEPTTTKT